VAQPLRLRGSTIRPVLKHVALLALLAVACNQKSPTEPEDTRVRGLLFGAVTIGPNCPVETVGQPCPTPPEAYSLRKVLVYDEAGKQLVSTVDIDSHGAYQAMLLPGKYTVDLKKVGLDRASGVPAVVTITASKDVQLDIQVDTGLR
jgi:hypothetical protein